MPEKFKNIAKKIGRAIVEGPLVTGKRVYDAAVDAKKKKEFENRPKENPITLEKKTVKSVSKSIDPKPLRRGGKMDYKRGGKIRNMFTDQYD
tara:strand:- start:442 stop:717 length:276 start_codon:yes stop_codon:yes gene_type:complete